MRFTVLHKRHHKVSQTVPFFMHCKTVTILLTIRVRRHFVMSITKNHEPHYVTVLDNPRIDGRFLRRLPLRSLLLYKVHPPFWSFFRLWPIVTKRWKRERYSKSGVLLQPPTTHLVGILAANSSRVTQPLQ